MRVRWMQLRLSMFGLVLAATAGCGAEMVRHMAPEKEERFARQYLRTLSDSGAESVLPRTLAETRALAGFPEFLQSLRGVLQRVPADSLVLDHWSVTKESGQPRRTKMVYSVRGLGGPYLIGLWMESEADHLVVNTVFCGSPPAEGHLRGDS
jgi:hypothetical protein